MEKPVKKQATNRGDPEHTDSQLTKPAELADTDEKRSTYTAVTMSTTAWAPSAHLEDSGRHTEERSMDMQKSLTS